MNSSAGGGPTGQTLLKRIFKGFREASPFVEYTSPKIRALGRKQYGLGRGMGEEISKQGFAFGVKHNQRRKAITSTITPSGTRAERSDYETYPDDNDSEPAEISGGPLHRSDSDYVGPSQFSFGFYWNLFVGTATSWTALMIRFENDVDETLEEDAAALTTDFDVNVCNNLNIAGGQGLPPEEATLSASNVGVLRTKLNFSAEKIFAAWTKIRTLGMVTMRSMVRCYADPTAIEELNVIFRLTPQPREEVGKALKGAAMRHMINGIGVYETNDTVLQETGTRKPATAATGITLRVKTGTPDAARATGRTAMGFLDQQTTDIQGLGAGQTVKAGEQFDFFIGTTDANNPGGTSAADRSVVQAFKHRQYQPAGFPFVFTVRADATAAGAGATSGQVRLTVHPRAVTGGHYQNIHLTAAGRTSASDQTIKAGLKVRFFGDDSSIYRIAFLVAQQCIGVLTVPIGDPDPYNEAGPGDGGAWISTKGMKGTGLVATIGKERILNTYAYKCRLDIAGTVGIMEAYLNNCKIWLDKVGAA